MSVISDDDHIRFTAAIQRYCEKRDLDSLINLSQILNEFFGDF